MNESTYVYRSRLRVRNAAIASLSQQTKIPQVDTKRLRIIIDVYLAKSKPMFAFLMSISHEYFVGFVTTYVWCNSSLVN